MLGILRRRAAVVAASALIVSGVVVLPSASAQTEPAFNINGIVPDANTNLIDDPEGNSSELGPINSNKTKIGVIHSAQPPMLGYTTIPAKVDVMGVWVDTKTVPDSQGIPQTWLYFAWQRESNSGSGVITYEFMKDEPQAACTYPSGTPSTEFLNSCNPFSERDAGDFIIVWDQQGSTINIVKRVWSGTYPNLTLGPPQQLGTAVAAVSSDGLRGEAMVNATTDLFPPNPTQCTTYANIIPGTVTGNSDTADYKDVVLTNDVPTVSNCGSVKVTKVTVPAGGTGEFGYTLNRAGGEAIRYATPPPTSATGTLTQDGDSESQVDLLPGTNYQLTETINGAAYALTSIVCGGSDITAGGTFAVVAGETTDCTITNTLQPGTLIVKKIVVNDNGGTKSPSDFSFQVNAGNAVSFEADGRNDVSVSQGQYKVTEPAVAGYTTSYDNCDVYVPAGGSATCTITNDDQPGTLIVQKVVINDNGGTKKAEDFSFTVDGNPAITFEADAENSLTVNAGTYTVTEPAADGYTTTYKDCSSIVIGNGETKTCIITNDDTKAQPSGSTTMSWVLKDSLAIGDLRAGAPDAASATVTFKVYSDEQCTALVGSEVSAITEGAASTSTGVTVTAAGTYRWTAQYSGDQYNEGFTTACGSEVTAIGATYNQ